MAEEITLQTDTQIEEETFSNRSYLNCNPRFHTRYLG